MSELADVMLAALDERKRYELVQTGYVRGEFVPFEGMVYRWTQKAKSQEGVYWVKRILGR